MRSAELPTGAAPLCPSDISPHCGESPPLQLTADGSIGRITLVEEVTYVIFLVTNVIQKVTNDTFSGSDERDIIRPYHTGGTKFRRRTCL